MKKINLIALCLLLSSPLIIKSSSESISEKSTEIENDIKDIKTAIKDKKAAADFSNSELQKKNSSLQVKIQDYMKLLATNMPTGTSEEQKAAKANQLDQKNYFKIQLQAAAADLQAQVTYIRTSLTAKTNYLHRLKNRSVVLNSMLVTNKDNGVVMLPARRANVEKQKNINQSDIAETIAEKTSLEKQLKDISNSIMQLQKFLNDKSIN
ncbi:hypothetical protein [Candidatus Chromulinivorax destructor]|uniref:Uncharacterized protein n=1 Tax=Candidatus Chromulinivorax destructor TaxID=2066483 RepID=A0A345ZAD1_9BACT|nr:hypothetical protein [Candidatus Chromulinivorax destructor]AXK60248.1 hypothetical protein C0J27_00585 [Candidatus Chromulinivorax destructor]